MNNENWLVYEDWFIWVILTITIIGSIIAGLVLNYFYKKDREI